MTRINSTRPRLPIPPNLIAPASVIQSVRRINQLKPEIPLFVGELGGNNGRVEDSVQNHLKFVREIQGLDGDGNQRYGEPVLVRSGIRGDYLVGYGTRVIVGRDYEGELAILGAHYTSMVEGDTNPAVLNSADPRTKTIDSNNWPQLLSYAVADTDNDTLSVTVNPFVYRDFLGEFQVYNGGQIDLTSFVPGTTGHHALVVLFLDQRDNTIAVHSSTSKAQTQTLTHAVDLAEIYDAASIFAIPIKGWRLIEGQTTILGSTLWDLRPFINQAQTLGFPNPVTRETVIPSGVTETVHGKLTINGKLTISGKLTIVKKPVRLTKIGASFGDVNAGNHSQFEDDGTYLMRGKARVWDDMRVPGLAVEKGASAPDLISVLASGNLMANGFNGAATMEQAFFTVQLPHGYKQGSDIDAHIHWMPTNNNAGDVKWQLEYSWANMTANFGAPTTVSIIDAASGTAWDHQQSDFSTIAGTGKEISSMLICRLFRDPTDGSDTYGSDAALLEIDFHYQLDTIGSRTENVK